MGNFSHSFPSYPSNSSLIHHFRLEQFYGRSFGCYRGDRCKFSHTNATEQPNEMAFTEHTPCLTPPRQHWDQPKHHESRINAWAPRSVGFEAVLQCVSLQDNTKLADISTVSTKADYGSKLGAEALDENFQKVSNLRKGPVAVWLESSLHMLLVKNGSNGSPAGPPGPYDDWCDRGVEFDCAGPCGVGGAAGALASASANPGSSKVALHLKQPLGKPWRVFWPELQFESAAEIVPAGPINLLVGSNSAPDNGVSAQFFSVYLLDLSE